LPGSPAHVMLGFKRAAPVGCIYRGLAINCSFSGCEIKHNERGMLRTLLIGSSRAPAPVGLFCCLAGYCNLQFIAVWSLSHFQSLLVPALSDPQNLTGST
jgi:hypothetical protein